MFPTEFSYRVVPREPYTGQLGPLPYDDPIWKIPLLLLALLLTFLTEQSAVADIAHKSDDVVIGTLFSSHLQKETEGPNIGKDVVDAALCELNGNRELPVATFDSAVLPPIQLLDAQSDEDFTAPINELDGYIQLSGETLSNEEIDELINDHSGLESEEDVEALRVFKSGARTGTTHAIITGVCNFTYKDGTRDFVNQVRMESLDPGDLPESQQNVASQSVIRSGDSGSLFVHFQTGKIVCLGHSGQIDDGAWGWGTRIREVMEKMKIRFREEEE